MSGRAHSLAVAAVDYFDPLLDERCALLWGPSSKENPSASRRSVRGTAWHALGLLLRDAPGDRERAVSAIEAVLAQQVVAPGQPWNGTFYRAPDEPNPPLFARMWDDYDPNWRQFIGTTWALILIKYPDRIPASLGPRLEDSIRRAYEGELAHGRLKPEYTNIALMHAFLGAFAGERLGRPDWVSESEKLADAVYALFKEHETFEEYNSPTYYGVDLFGLALWRAFGPTDKLRTLGSEMEAALWRDIARFYHAGMRNMCGPFDRGYGMDMTHYVSLTGAWMALVLDAGSAPLPRFDENMEHAHDLGFLPLFATIGPRVPDDAMRHFTHFNGERTVERQITPLRTATAWLGDEIMIGGEITKLSLAAGVPYSQFNPATIHWRATPDAIGWVLLKKAPRVDARAGANLLTIDAIGDSTFRISVPGLDASALAKDEWKLPGMSVRVENDAKSFTVKPGEFWTEIEYTDATKFILRTTRVP